MPMVDGKIQFDKVGINLERVIEKKLLEFAVHLTGIIQKNTPIASNVLSGSFAPFVQKEAESGYAVMVGSPLWDAYGAYAEFGTKPHWAPLEPLITWVRTTNRYSAIGVDFSSGKAVPARRGTIRRTKDDIVAIAKAVQFAISKKGTRSQRYVQKSLRQMGLQFKEQRDETGIYYTVDIVPWLESHGFWNELQGAGL